MDVPKKHGFSVYLGRNLSKLIKRLQAKIRIFCIYIGLYTALPFVISLFYVHSGMLVLVSECLPVLGVIQMYVYLIFASPYGNLDRKPMSPRTKRRIKSIRIAQLVLRMCELIGAVGMLFCVICIKGTDATTGWIIRVPVCITKKRQRHKINVGLARSCNIAHHLWYISSLALCEGTNTIIVS